MWLKLRFRRALLGDRSGRNKSERIRRSVDPTLIKPRNNCAGEDGESKGRSVLEEKYEWRDEWEKWEKDSEGL